MPTLSPVTDAVVLLIQLPAGITRESSRMKRSQSKRVWAAAVTAVRRCSLIEAKSVKEPSCLVRLSAASASWRAVSALLLLSFTELVVIT